MRRAALIVVVGLVLSGASAFAHHSYADFLTDQTVSIEGDVQELQFINPHVILIIRASDSSTYTAVWQAAYQLMRTGVSSTTLKVGDHVIVSGSPARDASKHELSRLSDVQRPGDGWRWSK